MDLPTIDTDHEDTDVASFFDVSDEFPFYDCSDSFSDQSEPSTSSPDPHTSPESSYPATPTLRRRLSSSTSEAGLVVDLMHKIYQDSDENSVKSESNERFVSEENEDEEHSIVTTTNEVPGRDSVVDEKDKIYQDSNENGVKYVSTQRFMSHGNENEEHSTVTNGNEAPSHDSVDSASELDGSSFNLLVFFAGLVIQAIGFQVNLFITFVTFPIWGVYNFCIFVIDPFQTVRRWRDYFIGKVSKLIELVCGSISPFIREWFKDQNSFWRLALRYGWGLLWAFYVGLVLCSLLASSLVLSGIIMRYLVEEPIQMKQVLNFDFTKLRPVAFVPIISCVDSGCGVGCDEEMEAPRKMRFRVIPASHKLQVTVSLTLPESEYNRNLGIFQVRVDLLSLKGETLASSSHPCMLQFKSEPIRLFSTFVRIAPLITGYGSESQTLNVKFKGFVEGDVPTACLKVSIEQRAEYRPGAGIPEMYHSSMVLDSELPLLRRWLWYWKMTIFVWIAMISFTIELLCTLVCCRPIIMPRVRPRVVRTRES